jgi:5-aminopentanamidase
MSPQTTMNVRLTIVFFIAGTAAVYGQNTAGTPITGQGTEAETVNPASQQTASLSAGSIARPEGNRIRVAVIQMLPATGDPPANIQRADRLARQAVREHGAQVLLFPECTLTGYTHPADGRMTLAQTRELAEPADGPSTRHFAGVARELGVYIVWSIHERREGQYFNSAVLLSPEGEIKGTYSKVHINKYETQMGWTNGDRFYVWPCRIGDVSFNIGIMICFDREVPEAARCLTMLGADVILVPQATACTAMFPIHREQLRVRAFENEVYVAMSNWGGPVFRGYSMIIDPTGEVLKLGSEQEEILIADLDLDQLRKLRENGIYGRHHRNPGTYGPLLTKD